MKFFTDKTVINKYLLVKITDYLKMKDFSRWECVFIDPEVWQLTKSNEYSWIDKIDIENFIRTLPKNHFFSWDYPSDMNLQYSELFLKKTWNNAIKYSKYPQYIVTVQSKFHDYMSFVEWFNKYNALNIKSGILGLGNFCRIKYFDNFIDYALRYAFKKCRHQRIHVYGLALDNIPFAVDLAKRNNIDLSIDSTKWTRGDEELKKKYGYISCRAHNRQEYFDHYKNKIRRRVFCRN